MRIVDQANTNKLQDIKNAAAEFTTAVSRLRQGEKNIVRAIGNIKYLRERKLPLFRIIDEATRESTADAYLQTAEGRKVVASLDRLLRLEGKYLAILEKPLYQSRDNVIRMNAQMAYYVRLQFGDAPYIDSRYSALAKQIVNFYDMVVDLFGFAQRRWATENAFVGQFTSESLVHRVLNWTRARTKLPLGSGRNAMLSARDDEMREMISFRYGKLEKQLKYIRELADGLARSVTDEMQLEFAVAPLSRRYGSPRWSSPAETTRYAAQNLTQNSEIVGQAVGELITGAAALTLGMSIGQGMKDR
jgi:hypothetical protein